MKSWKLKAYTNAAFTDLVRVPASVRSLIIANTTGGAVNTSVRIAKAGVEEAVIVPVTEIDANTAKILDLCELNINQGDTLQVLGSAAGLHFTASGFELNP